ncbi:MAG: hypothetical protein ABIN94_08570 [Ferruginibacter sp.]
MDTRYKAGQWKNKLVFSLILLAIVGVVSIVFLTIVRQVQLPSLTNSGTRNQVSSSATNYKPLLENNEIVTGYLDILQRLDKQYASLSAVPASKHQLDSIEHLIYLREEAFRATIDSIALSPEYTDNNLNEASNSLIASYKTILENRTTVAHLRIAAALGKNGFDTSQMAMLQNKNLLQEKTNKISSLESELKTMLATNTDFTTKANASDKVAQLEETLSRQESRIAVLTNNISALKLDNERLQKQPVTTIKVANTTDATFKAKANTLQQRVDALSAELRLAQVDCNLSRVDGQQAIYNAKQRKQLLSEASGILTSLSQSGDPEITKKVQSKIALLNRVAASSKD